MSTAAAAPRPRSASRAAVDDKVSLSERKDCVSLSVANSGPVRRQGLRFSACGARAASGDEPPAPAAPLLRHREQLLCWRSAVEGAQPHGRDAGPHCPQDRALMSYTQRDFTTAMAKRDKDAFYFSMVK
eukprot:SM000005S17163  [mRNA]  locus=s5:564051:564647:+ [translate_table: standard]